MANGEAEEMVAAPQPECASLSVAKNPSKGTALESLCRFACGRGIAARAVDEPCHLVQVVDHLLLLVKRRQEQRVGFQLNTREMRNRRLGLHIGKLATFSTPHDVMQ